MQPVAPFLHDYETANGVGPECLQFSTTRGDISVLGQTSGRELMRRTDKILLVHVGDRDGTRGKQGASTPDTPMVQPKSTKKTKTNTKKKQKNKTKQEPTETNKESGKPSNPNKEGTVD